MFNQPNIKYRMYDLIEDNSEIVIICNKSGYAAWYIVTPIGPIPSVFSTDPHITADSFVQLIAKLESYILNNKPELIC